jgi:hypothetical protein
MASKKNTDCALNDMPSSPKFLIILLLNILLLNQADQPAKPAQHKQKGKVGIKV